MRWRPPAGRICCPRLSCSAGRFGRFPSPTRSLASRSRRRTSWPASPPVDCGQSIAAELAGRDRAEELADAGAADACFAFALPLTTGDEETNITRLGQSILRIYRILLEAFDLVKLPHGRSADFDRRAAPLLPLVCLGLLLLGDSGTHSRCQGQVRRYLQSPVRPPPAARPRASPSPTASSA